MPIVIPAGNASEWTGRTGNNTFLLPAAPATLIDAGVGAPAHLEALDRTLGTAPLQLLLITHGHVDHASGVPLIERRWPSVVVRGGGGTALTEGERVACGATTLRALHTPGHSPDHFCFLDESTEEIYSGDLVRIGGTVVIPASRGGDLRQYLSSLRRIRDLRPSRLLPAHGPAIENPAAVIEYYLAHREQRHREVTRLVSEGVREVDTLVARIYPGISPRLVDAARETVRAHLACLDGPL